MGGRRLNYGPRFAGSAGCGNRISDATMNRMFHTNVTKRKVSFATYMKELKAKALAGDPYAIKQYKRMLCKVGNSFVNMQQQRSSRKKPTKVKLAFLERDVK